MLCFVVEHGIDFLLLFFSLHICVYNLMGINVTAKIRYEFSTAGRIHILQNITPFNPRLA